MEDLADKEDREEFVPIEQIQNEILKSKNFQPVDLSSLALGPSGGRLGGSLKKDLGERDSTSPEASARDSFASEEASVYLPKRSLRDEWLRQREDDDYTAVVESKSAKPKSKGLLQYYKAEELMLARHWVTMRRKLPAPSQVINEKLQGAADAELEQLDQLEQELKDEVHDLSTAPSRPKPMSNETALSQFLASTPDAASAPLKKQAQMLEQQSILDILERGSTTSADATTIYFENGQEQSTDKSFLHQWKPEHTLRGEEKWDRRMMSFACARGSQSIEEREKNQKTLGDKDPMKVNRDIIAGLERMKTLYEMDNVRGKALGYRKAISMLRSLKEPITDIKQLDKLSYIGDGIKKKIAEFLNTGKMHKVEFLSKDEKLKAIEDLAEVWGVGPNGALKLYGQGIKSVEDLREKGEHLLNKMQKIGLKYHEEISQRIPRSEVTEIFETVKKGVRELRPKEEFIVEACGSYRRGKSSCGDVDVLITTKSHANEVQRTWGLLELLVTKLEEEGFLKERLGQLKYSHNLSQTYMGICKLQSPSADGQPRIHRRLDIKIYPRSQFAFALLYFTGSAHFNRSMRLFAQKKGYTLSDFGLSPAIRGVVDGSSAQGSKRKIDKLSVGSSIPCHTEEDIFKALHLPMKEPGERDV